MFIRSYETFILCFAKLFRRNTDFLKMKLVASSGNMFTAITTSAYGTFVCVGRKDHLQWQNRMLSAVFSLSVLGRYEWKILNELRKWTLVRVKAQKNIIIFFLFWPRSLCPPQFWKVEDPSSLQLMIIAVAWSEWDFKSYPFSFFINLSYLGSHLHLQWV